MKPSNIARSLAAATSLATVLTAQSVAATAIAETQMQACTVAAGCDTVPSGTDLSTGLLLYSNGLTGGQGVFMQTARTTVTLDAATTRVVYEIEDFAEEVPFSTQTLGLGADCGPHTTRLTLSSPQPVEGLLRVEYRAIGTATASVDVGADGSVEWDEQDGNWSEGIIWEQPLTLDGSVDILTTTGVSAHFLGVPGTGSSNGTLTIEYSFARLAVLPSTHHLSASDEVVQWNGSTDWWRDNGSRFQLLYAADHFLEAGVTGPITIERLRFRGEDGQPNLGGQLWTDVAVRIGTTSIQPGGLDANYTLNMSPFTTTVSPLQSLGEVRMFRSDGTVPNNDCILLDLLTAGAAFTYDPTDAQRPNLIIEVVVDALGESGVGPIMPIQDAAGSAGGIDGQGLFAAGTAPAVGTLTDQPPVVTVEYEGSGGSGFITPARNEYYGAACGGQPSAFYQAFLSGQPFDLTGLVLTPDAYPSPNTYSVATQPPQPIGPVTGTPASTADDGLVPHPLGFTFDFPGGSTTEIQVCTNGYLWLDGSATGIDYSPSVEDWLGHSGPTPPRLAPCWYDLHAGRNGNGGLFIESSGTPGNRVCTVTWWRVGAFNTVAASGHAIYSMCCRLHETGEVEFLYDSMPAEVSTHQFHSDPDVAALVGFSRGTVGGMPSVDPQSRDLSVEVPFSTSIEGANGNIGLRAVGTPAPHGVAYGGRLFAGNALTWEATNVPASALLGLLLLDISASRPGINIPGIHAAGCVESTSLDPVLFELFPLPGSTVTGTAPLLVPQGYHPGLNGFVVHAQFVLLDGLFGAGPLVSASSNAIRHTVGLR